MPCVSILRVCVRIDRVRTQNESTLRERDRAGGGEKSEAGCSKRPASYTVVTIGPSPGTRFLCPWSWSFLFSSRSRFACGREGTSRLMFFHVELKEYLATEKDVRVCVCKQQHHHHHHHNPQTLITHHLYPFQHCAVWIFFSHAGARIVGTIEASATWKPTLTLVPPPRRLACAGGAAG